jgi:hypothetical protein
MTEKGGGIGHHRRVTGITGDGGHLGKKGRGGGHHRRMTEKGGGRGHYRRVKREGQGERGAMKTGRGWTGRSVDHLWNGGGMEGTGMTEVRRDRKEEGVETAEGEDRIGGYQKRILHNLSGLSILLYNGYSTRCCVPVGSSYNNNYDLAGEHSLEQCYYHRNVTGHACPLTQYLYLCSNADSAMSPFVLLKVNNAWTV